MKNNNNLINYTTLLKNLEEDKQGKKQAHLLLGNGFNNSLGVDTSQKEIFEKMGNFYEGYKSLQDFFEEECNCDIEKLIGNFKDRDIKEESKLNLFRSDFDHDKIKLDFMKATYEIVKGKIDEIYKEKNKGIYLLLKNFNNYFSLNYDPLLYLLLMKFKKDDDEIGSSIAIQDVLGFQKERLNQDQENLYNEIKDVYEQENVIISLNNKSATINLKKCQKNYFTNLMKDLFKDENQEKIEAVSDRIWKEKDKSHISEEENKSSKLEKINDGFSGSKTNGKKVYTYENPKSQNLFFLHGSFHIHQDNKKIYKITQEKGKALYEKLEEAINNEEKDIICVLESESEDKKNKIEGNEYLKRAYQKLSEIEGSLVIFGSSLAENDKHIFERINENPNIKKLYISSCKDTIGDDEENANKHFPEKEIIFFNWATVLYYEKSES